MKSPTTHRNSDHHHHRSSGSNNKNNNKNNSDDDDTTAIIITNMDTSIHKKRSKSHEHDDDDDINDRKKRQKRQKYTEDELNLLEQVYAAGCKLPSLEKRQELAQVLGRSARSVQIWFQNKRQKEKREQMESHSNSSSSSSGGSSSNRSGAAMQPVLYHHHHHQQQQEQHQKAISTSSLYYSQDMVGSWVTETARCHCHSIAAMTSQSDAVGRECCGKCSAGCSANHDSCNCSSRSVANHVLPVSAPPSIANNTTNTGNSCMCTNMAALMKRCNSCGHDTARHSTVGCAELGCNCLICPSLVVKKTIGEWTFAIKKLQIEQWSAVSTGPQHEYSGMRIVFDMVDHHSTDISWELDFNPTYETRRFTIGAADVRALTWKEMDESTSALVIQLHRHPRFSVISRRITRQQQQPHQQQQQLEDHTQCSHVENELGQWSFSSDFTPNQIASKFNTHVVYFDRHMQENLINRLKMALKVRFDSVIDHHLLENSSCSPYFAYVPKDQQKFSMTDIVLNNSPSDAECDDCGHLVDDHGLIGCNECNSCIVFVPRTSAADANGDSAFSLWKKVPPSPTALTSVLDRHFILPTTWTD